MNNFLDKKFLILSICLHIFIFFVLHLFQSSKIKKSFVAYGRHSRVLTHAYFRKLTAPKLDYKKYYPQRRKKKKKVVRKTPSKLKTVKKAIKKQVAKSPVKKLVKKTVKKLVKKTAKPKKVEKPKEEKPKEEEILHFNLMGESDPKMIMYQQCIQREVDRLWSPPIGVPKGTECIVSVVVDQSGAVKIFKIINPSKVLIYNLSIVKVSKTFRFAKCLWDKSFTINFMQ